MLRVALWVILGISPVFGQGRTMGQVAVSAPGIITAGDVGTAIPISGSVLPDHKISPNDLIQISVFDEPQLSKSTRVGSDGTIVMPLLKGGLRVEGLLPRELEAAFERDLIDQQILVHPIVSVAILEYATRLISVVGAVKNPGQFPVTGPITLLEAMAKAGWANSDAGPVLLLTRFDSEAPRRINIAELLQASTDPSLNVVLSGGEVINIPDAAKIWVTGNVSKPQAVAVKNPADATVLKFWRTWKDSLSTTRKPPIFTGRI
jgi:polysaccharide biosynthesis/export protein